LTAPVHDLDTDAFGQYLREIPMSDVGGRLTGSEKSAMACGGERWVLVRVNPHTLAPVGGRPRRARAIVYSAFMEDVLDGRHRRARAVAQGAAHLSAWVGLDQDQYERWQATGTWIAPDISPTGPVAPGKARKMR
jgi:hypothetical protein